MSEELPTGQDAPQSQPEPLHGTQLALLTIAIALATFMEVLDLTIVNVSVPAIAGSLGVSPNEGTWTISSYSLAAAIMQPLTGWLGRRFGEVRTFVTSMSLFVVFSALCGMASSMPMLVACRLLQGAVSGPMVPMAQALLIRNFPREKIGVAMGLWAMVIFVAPIFGPILGGWITDNYSWPWLFYINLPIGALSVFMVATLLKGRDSQRVKVPVDVVGLALLVIGVGALQFMLDNGNDKDWFNSWLITTSAIAAVVALTVLIVWELTDRHPIVDLALFRIHNYRIAVICICCGFFCFFGVTVVYPLWLQLAMGYTATWAGLATAPVGVLALLLMPYVGRTLDTMNLRVASSFGFLAMAGSMLWLSTMNEQASFGQIIAPRLLQGVGLAFFFLPLNKILLSPMRPDQVASAAGLSNFLRTMTGSVSTAVCIWVWSRRTDSHGATLSEHITSTGNWPVYRSHLQQFGVQGVAALRSAEELILQQARTMGANDLFRAFGYVFILLAPLVWLARPPFRNPGGPPGAH
ncbi:MAG TPA: DHA2 family efflux MFS transporter permease subunit [Steroidobacteraceae bacterium]|nr:DHA2 family efflux MFS transporter permease subunit [Steroidobacteraceae bacterium]